MNDQGWIVSPGEEREHVMKPDEIGELLMDNSKSACTKISVILCSELL